MERTVPTIWKRAAMGFVCGPDYHHRVYVDANSKGAGLNEHERWTLGFARACTRWRVLCRQTLSAQSACGRLIRDG